MFATCGRRRVGNLVARSGAAGAVAIVVRPAGEKGQTARRIPVHHVSPRRSRARRPLRTSSPSGCRSRRRSAGGLVPPSPAPPRGARRSVVPRCRHPATCRRRSGPCSSSESPSAAVANGSQSDADSRAHPRRDAGSRSAADRAPPAAGAAAPGSPTGRRSGRSPSHACHSPFLLTTIYSSRAFPAPRTSVEGPINRFLNALLEFMRNAGARVVTIDPLECWAVLSTLTALEEFATTLAAPHMTPEDF